MKNTHAHEDSHKLNISDNRLTNATVDRLQRKRGKRKTNYATSTQNIKVHNRELKTLTNEYHV